MFKDIPQSSMQARLPRCARRRVDRSGQAWHPRLRAGGAARDGAAGPCGGTIGVEGLECQRLAAVRDSTECCAPAPDLQSEHSAPDRGCGLRNAEIEPGRPSGRALGLRMTDFDPGGALEWDSEGELGLRNAEIEPGRPSRRALGLRMIDFDPG